jgi:hypothetical protein
MCTHAPSLAKGGILPQLTQQAFLVAASALFTALLGESASDLLAILCGHDRFVKIGMLPQITQHLGGYWLHCHTIWVWITEYGPLVRAVATSNVGGLHPEASTKLTSAVE